MSLRCTLLRCLTLVACSVIHLGEGAATLRADENVPMRSVKIDEIQFQIPADYELTKVANESLVKWPVVADWDEQGNLLVVESGGVGSPIVEHNELALHRIVKLIDENNDGTFDLRKVVVDKLPFTEGVLSYDQSIYACAPPHIWKFSDLDRDGVYEQRDIWFDGQTLTFCANDLHGPYLGRDGWIYWCKGAFAEQTHELRSGKVLKSEAAHVFRRHPSGGPIDVCVTGGMDNPVELAFSQTGERFFTSTFLHHPGNGVRDGIAHGIYGGVYGKPHSVIDNHPQTGDLMPVMVELGPAAPSGLCFADRFDFPSDWTTSSERLIATLFNLQKVSAFELKRAGATYEARTIDLLQADRIDFHPTDILEAADGSLIVIDTGGWYDLCCPTSKIDQATANGGIYRLSKMSSKADVASSANGNSSSSSERSFTGRGAVLPKKTPSDWSQVDVKWLTAFIHDRNPWTARSALAQLAKLGDADQQVAVELLGAQLADGERPQAFRLRSLWASSWLSHPAARQLCLNALDDQDAAVVQAACHIAGLHYVTAANEKLIRHLSHPDDHVVRAAAEAIGRLQVQESIKPLLDRLARPDIDRVLQHSIMFALIEIGDSDALKALLAGDSLNELQLNAAFVVLDQLNAGPSIGWEVLSQSLESENESLALVAAKLVNQRESLEPAVRDWLLERLQSSTEDSTLSSSCLMILREWKNEDAIQTATKELLQQWIQRDSPDHRVRHLIELYDGEAIPESWDKLIASWLKSTSQEDLSSVLSIVQRIDLQQASETQRVLVERAQNADVAETSLMLLAVLPEATKVSQALEAKVIAAIQADDEVLNNLAFDVLDRIQVSSEGGDRLVSSLGKLTPRALSAAVVAIERIGSDSLDEEMLGLLVDLPAARTLNLEQLNNLYQERSPELQARVSKTMDSLSQSSKDVETEVLKRLARLPEGDAAKGMQLFRSQKAACASCHRVEYVGGKIGPELSQIGRSRTRQALLEAIMFPSARLEQSYHSTKVLTNDGQVYNGLLVRAGDGESIELQINADKSIIFPKSNVEEMERSEVSIMPAGLAELLSDQELADLLKFLESAK